MAIAVITTVFLVLFAAMFIFAILACCLKEKKKLFAVDGLLISATLLILLTVSSSYFLPPTKKPASVARQTKAIKQCDSAVDSLGEAVYLEGFSEPTHTIVALMSSGKIDKELKEAEEAVQKHANDYPNNSEIAARLAIILHAEGKDAEPIFERFSKKDGGLSSLLQSLEFCYSKPNAEHSPSWKTLESSKNLQGLQNPSGSQRAQSPQGSEKLAATIKSTLPQGWYRTTALIDLYKKYDSNKLKKAEDDDQKDAESWRFRIQILLLLTGSFIVLGVVGAVRFLKFRKTDLSEVIPMTTQFRRMYACLISSYFAQVVAGLAFGIWVGITAALAHKPYDLSEHNVALSATLMVSGAVFLWLLFYLLILKPQKLSVEAAFTRSAIKISTVQFVTIAFGGFCASVALNTVARFLYHLVPNAGRSSNPAQLDIVNAIVSNNLPLICWSFLLACVIAPVTEEIMFRGLLQGWLRTKFGATVAIIGNSLLFALWHCDPHGFVQYFAIGLSQSYVYSKTRNLWLAICIHSLWNFWVMSTIFWVTSYHK